jgi:NAD(P)-dependent dehydrogenase (short-subunit alcohol dehydrogenase family)
MDPELKGHTALITGGSSGIGFGIARSLAQEGVNLAIASRNPDANALEELRNWGVEVLRIEANVSQEAQVKRMVAETISHYGHLDHYVNNAAWEWHEPVTHLTTNAWMNTIHTNLSACVWACREVSRHMIQREKGSILIVGSTASMTPLYKEASYRVSKTGLITYAEVLAIELAPYRIRVNMLIPGPFITRITETFFAGEKSEVLRNTVPMKRIGQPAECGPAAVLLLSDKLSSYTTGGMLVIDGGLRLHPIEMYTDEAIYTMNAPQSWERD